MAVTKKIRFEVFKRDSFTCQYCGRKAPDVILNADHVHPKSKGGKDVLLNLITSCKDCNSGKSDRLLVDTDVLDKQRSQLEELQERREQIDMMFEWQQGLMSLQTDVVDRLHEVWAKHTGNTFALNDEGIAGLRKLARRFSVSEIMEAMSIATDQYMKFVAGEPTNVSVNVAWGKIPGICRNLKNPESGRIFYVRGILRNRFNYVNDGVALGLLREAVNSGADMDHLEQLAKVARTWTVWQQFMDEYTAELNGVDDNAR